MGNDECHDDERSDIFENGWKRAPGQRAAESQNSDPEGDFGNDSLSDFVTGQVTKSFTQEQQDSALN